MQTNHPICFVLSVSLTPTLLFLTLSRSLLLPLSLYILLLLHAGPVCKFAESLSSFCSFFPPHCQSLTHNGEAAPRDCIPAPRLCPVPCLAVVAQTLPAENTYLTSEGKQVRLMVQTQTVCFLGCG